MIKELAWPQFLDDFAAVAKAQGFSEHTLCNTSAGPMQAWTRGTAGLPRIMISSGIHGDEPAGPLALLECLRCGDFSADSSWSLCPALNPTGLAAGSRENHDGMDLNRDYRTRRTLEVSSHAAWLDMQPVPDLFLSLHEDWETKGFYLYEINQGEDTPARSTAILKAVKPWFAAEPGPLIDGHEIRSPGWIYHRAEADFPEEWPEAIHIAKLGCPLSFTFETPSSATLASRVAALRDALRAACRKI
jgi:predicted deacylase